jgi:hypothetical protein
MVKQYSQAASKHQVRRVFSMALALVAGIFFFHTGVLFEVARHLLVVNDWLARNYGHATAGKGIVLACFFVLFITHFIEAAAWGLFLWRKGLSTSFTEGVYFSATSITGLGYGDVVLRPPWRMLGPLVSISGILMFGCSTAFLFLILEKMWILQI